MTHRTKENIAALLFILPSFIGFFVFMFIPIISVVVLSFTNFKGAFHNLKFSLKNYVILFNDNSFQQILLLTFIVVVIATIMLNILGFFFAYLINKKMPGRYIFRSILFLPVVLSSIAICLSFILIFNPTQGPMNHILTLLGLKALPWLGSSKTAMMTILIVFIWQNFGYYMVIYLGGLQGINPSLYEAAEIDGATERQKLRYVTLPSLSPIIFFSIIISIINAFKIFDFIYIMTGGQLGGGPGNSTNVIAFDIYIRSFVQWDYGRACAEAVVLFIIVLTITIVQYQGQKKWVSYDIV